MRLMLVTTSLIVGGAENQVYLLAKEFRRRGHEVALVSLTEPGAYVDELRSLGISVHSLDMRHRASDILALTRLGRLVRSWRPDVLHAHMFHAVLLSRVVRLWTRVPVLVSTTHNFAPESQVRATLYRVTDGLSTITTNVSLAGTAKYVASGAVPRGRMVAFPNGIPVQDTASGAEARRSKREELGLDGAFTWLAVGRLEAPKDYPTLLRGIDGLLRLGSESRFLVVGEGSESPRVMELHERLGGLQGRVTFLGSRRDVPELMSASDGYVMSSCSEGLPLVLLEASAAGLPIVATDVGGNGEVVQDGRSGFIVPARAPDSLAGAMRKLELLPESERRAMGAFGRERVKASYEIGAVAERWLRAFAEWSAPGRPVTS